MSTALTADDHRAILKDMAEVGMRLVRDLPERVETSSPEALALAYTRLSRAVRLTLSLDRQFEVPVRAQAPAPPPPIPKWEYAGVTREVWEAEQLTKSRTAEAYDLVERAIDCGWHGRARDELTEALYDRMDEGADEQRLISTMPIAQVVTLICRDLGIRPKWKDLDTGDDEDADFEPDERTMLALRLGKYELAPPRDTALEALDFDRPASARAPP
jgi:hypothetical protein